MDLEIAALLRRIERIESVIVGDEGKESVKIPALENLLKFNSDMVQATNGRERIQSVFRKVHDIDHFLAPYWLDLEKNQSQAAKAEVIFSEEQNIHKMAEDLETLSRLKPVLESKALEDTPDLIPRLVQVRAAQTAASREAEEALSGTRQTLMEQNQLVNDLNRFFLSVDDSLTTLEMAKNQRNLPSD